MGLPAPFLGGDSMCSDVQFLTISPSGLFLPPADVENEKCHKHEQDDASCTYAKDEVDIHTSICTLDFLLSAFLTDVVTCRALELYSIQVAPLVYDHLIIFSDPVPILIQF